MKACLGIKPAFLPNFVALKQTYKGKMKREEKGKINISCLFIELEIFFQTVKQLLLNFPKILETFLENVKPSVCQMTHNW